MMAIISNENETEDIYLLDITIKETPQKQPHTQPTRSNGPPPHPTHTFRSTPMPLSWRYISNQLNFYQIGLAIFS
jgi:hypothetical protein